MPQTHVVEGDLVVTGSLISSKIVYASDSIITLPPATVPLTGGEYIAIYQNGNIVKYPVGTLDYPDNAASIKYFPFGATVGAGGTSPQLSRLKISGTEGAIGTGAGATIELYNGTHFTYLAHSAASNTGDFVIKNNNKTSLATIAGAVYAVFSADGSVAFGNGSINSYGQHVWNAAGAGAGGILGTDFSYVFNPALSGQGFNLSDQYGSRLVMMRPTANTVPGKVTNIYGTWNFNGALVVPSGGVFTIANGATTAINGVLYAKAGMTVGAGAGAPSTGSRLRIDQTDGAGSLAVIEFWNGSVVSHVYLSDPGSSSLLNFSNSSGIRYQTTTGTMYSQFNVDGSFSLTGGRLTANAAGLLRATVGMVIGQGSGSPLFGSRLRIDCSDNPSGGYSVVEFYNGTTNGLFGIEPEASGKRLSVLSDNGFSIHLLSGSGSPYFAVANGGTITAGSGQFQVDVNGIARSYGLSVGQFGALQSGSGRLFVDRTDGATGPSYMVLTNGTHNNYYMCDTVANGGHTGVLCAADFILYNANGSTQRFRVGSNGFAFFGGTPQVKQTIFGSRGGNAALASLLTALAGHGILTDSSTA